MPTIAEVRLQRVHSLLGCHISARLPARAARCSATASSGTSPPRRKASPGGAPSDRANTARPRWRGANTCAPPGLTESARVAAPALEGVSPKLLSGGGCLSSAVTSGAPVARPQKHARVPLCGRDLRRCRRSVPSSTLQAEMLSRIAATGAKYQEEGVQIWLRIFERPRPDFGSVSGDPLRRPPVKKRPGADSPQVSSTLNGSASGFGR